MFTGLACLMLFLGFSVEEIDMGNLDYCQETTLEELLNDEGAV